MGNNKSGMRIMAIASKKAGFTLIELLIVVAIMGLIIGAIYKVADLTLLTYHASDDRQILVPQARHALERMVMFVQESDQIQEPSTMTPMTQLTVSERVSDQYNNESHVYVAGGDGFLDADNNSPANGLINEDEAGGSDPAEFITFRLDKTDAAIPCLNKCLKEKMPNYGTPRTDDYKSEIILCEYVTEFLCRRLSPGIVEIILTLQKGSSTVTLKTTAKSRWVE
jgi:prepilin-type N-terminal cleavage/methylation domain-containing protein